MAKKNLINADMLLATPRKVEPIAPQAPPQYSVEKIEPQRAENLEQKQPQTASNTEGGILQPKAAIMPTVEPLTPPVERTITSVQRGLKIGETRATLIVQEAALEKIKAIAYWDRQSIKDVVQAVFDTYIADYEAKNGAVKPLP